MPDVIPVSSSLSEEESRVGFYRELYGSRTYRYDAISGAQIKVKLGDHVLVEDCTAVQFTLTQAKKPVYGYHSQLFDAVAPGVVIVHGRLWMNFIHQGYLRILMEGYRSGGDLFANLKESLAPEAIPDTNEELISYIKSQNQKTLEELTNRVNRSTKEKDQLKLRPDELPSIEIIIDYGDRSRFKSQSAGGPSPVPRKRIYAVHFIGEGQDNQISGQPIQEWYEFIAQKVT